MVVKFALEHKRGERVTLMTLVTHYSKNRFFIVCILSNLPIRFSVGGGTQAVIFLGIKKFRKHLRDLRSD